MCKRNTINKRPDLIGFQLLLMRLVSETQHKIKGCMLKNAF